MKKKNDNFINLIQSIAYLLQYEDLLFTFLETCVSSVPESVQNFTHSLTGDSRFLQVSQYLNLQRRSAKDQI